MLEIGDNVMVLDNVVSCNKGSHLPTLNKMKGKVFKIRKVGITLNGRKKYMVGKYTLWIKDKYLKKVTFKEIFNELRGDGIVQSK